MSPWPQNQVKGIGPGPRRAYAACGICVHCGAMLVILSQGLMDGWPGGHPSARPIEGGKPGPPDRPWRPAAARVSDAPRPERPSVLLESMAWPLAATRLVPP